MIGPGRGGGGADRSVAGLVRGYRRRRRENGLSLAICSSTSVHVMTDALEPTRDDGTPRCALVGDVVSTHCFLLDTSPTRAASFLSSGSSRVNVACVARLRRAVSGGGEAAMERRGGSPRPTHPPNPSPVGPDVPRTEGREGGEMSAAFLRDSSGCSLAGFPLLLWMPVARRSERELRGLGGECGGRRTSAWQGGGCGSSRPSCLETKPPLHPVAGCCIPVANQSPPHPSSGMRGRVHGGWWGCSPGWERRFR